MNPIPVDIVCAPMTGALLAAYRALEARVPFVLFALPGKSRPVFMADIEGRNAISDKRFVIVPWLDSYSDGIVIRDTVSVRDFLKKIPDIPSPCYFDNEFAQPSTDKLVYKGQLYNVIDILREQQGGKVVISRVINYPLKGIEDVEQVALLTFQLFLGMDKECLRYIYYTPQTGCWIASTPELLLDFQATQKYAYSMALAGTRKFSHIGNCPPWDEKNLYEHDLVLKYIAETIEAVGGKQVEISDRDLRYHELEHRCHDIRFLHEGIPANRFLDALNPTPALGGFPRKLALEIIEHLELHQRQCYGGYVVVEDDENKLAYVNLRCGMFDKNSCTVYVGGGITPDSKPEDEWKETEAKARHLLEALSVGVNTTKYIKSKSFPKAD